MTLREARKHYYTYGRKEGRFPRLRPPVFRENPSGQRGRKPYIFLVAHEASRTGAPILALALIPRLRVNYRVIVILKRGGPLEDEFHKASAGVIVFPDYGHASFDLTVPLEPYVSRFRPEFSIVNSAEVSGFVVALETMNVPCVFLVHEFYDNVANKSSLDESFGLSSAIVFPAAIVADSHTGGSTYVANRTYRIRHQGLPPIPREAGKKSEPLVADSNEDKAPPKTTVIGLGTVIPRKGVDLFVQAAHYVVNVHGLKDVEFRWYGDQVDIDYKNQLLTQIRHSGLGQHVFLSDPVDDLDPVFEKASALFISSRLDPFPNVGIQGLVTSTPLVAFQGSTGIAEWLFERDYSRMLVVPYLDTFAASRVLVDLLSDKRSLNLLGAKLGRRAKKEFGLDEYVDDLVSMGRDAASNKSARATAIQKIYDSKLFDFELFSGARIPEQDAEKVIARYVQMEGVYNPKKGWNYNLRRAVPGLNTYQFSELNPTAVSRPGRSPLATFIDHGAPSGPWMSEPIVISQARTQPTIRTTRVLMHLHLHYLDLLDDFLSRLKGNVFENDLFITTSSRNSVAWIESTAKSHGVRATVRVTKNVGRDLVPFLDYALPEAIEKKYDLVAHLHSKKSLRLNEDSGAGWREFLWTTLVGGRGVNSANHIVGEMSRDDTLGLVFATDALYCGWDQNKHLAERLMDRLGLRANLTEHFDFPVGTMFWARPNALAKLSRFKLDVPPEPLQADGTELHALERCIPHIVRSEGFDVRTARFPGIQR
jgi:glycosyltransferase involved in cell wall biosynthesis